MPGPGGGLMGYFSFRPFWQSMAVLKSLTVSDCLQKVYDCLQKVYDAFFVSARNYIYVVRNGDTYKK